MYSRDHGPLNGGYLGGINSSGQVDSYEVPSVADIRADPKTLGSFDGKLWSH